MSESYEIPLTRGKVAIVSVEDYEYLMQRKWHAWVNYGYSYAHRKGPKGSTIRMHRIVLSRMLGHEDFALVDHIDGNGLNNQRSNLRPATKKQNYENLQGAYKNNKSSGIRGVSWHKGKKKWTAKISHNGKQIYLGSFDDISSAEQAAIAARNEYFTHHTS